MVPPTSTHSSRISAPNCSARCELAGLVGVEQDQRMQVAVAGVEHVRAAQAVLLLHAPRSRCSTSRQALARDGAVHAVVVGRDAADGRERGLAAGPEAQALGLARARRACASRRSPRSTAFMRSISSATSSRRAVGFAQQDRCGVEVVAGVHEGSTARGRGLVHHLQAGRDDAGGDHVRDRVAALCATSSNAAMMHCARSAASAAA